MGRGALDNPSVEINNDSIFFKPNSIVFQSGSGEKKVRTQSAGGGSIEVIVTEDAETKKSMFKGTLLASKSAYDNINKWQGLFENSIVLSGPGYTESFRKMVLINDPERSLSAEGEAEVIFEGPPIV